MLSIVLDLSALEFIDSTGCACSCRPMRGCERMADRLALLPAPGPCNASSNRPASWIACRSPTDCWRAIATCWGASVQRRRRELRHSALLPRFAVSRRPATRRASSGSRTAVPRVRSARRPFRRAPAQRVGAPPRSARSRAPRQRAARSSDRPGVARSTNRATLDGSAQRARVSALARIRLALMTPKTALRVEPFGTSVHR